ncbi:succinate dehydrogenase cytochrome b subunit [Faecalibacter sp. LW9]|uniref:succinate dehydrogenase cytochrome b subunit n=1 Tax=Faecalibacter sp. LW9 TaxID=3103144 RepID=UPI002AFED448|nr:succinate dehydrogenase cytochrome b subunit [Faecalibacter sp. LW9]
MANESLLKSSIGRKFAMALSALFLLVFLLQHLVINLLSVINPNGFNEVSAFMSANPIIQFVMQPVLLFGVVYHFVMGFVLEIQNKKARGPVAYAKYNGAANSSWMSRNMIISGAVILLFLLVHLWQFWVPTINAHYVNVDPNFGEGNFFMDHVNHVFTNAVTLVLYVVAFVFLSLHLQHGFASAFQSIGARHARYTPIIVAFGKWYSILVPALFIIIAIYHFVNNL